MFLYVLPLTSNLENNIIIAAFSHPTTSIVSFLFFNYAKFEILSAYRSIYKRYKKKVLQYFLGCLVDENDIERERKISETTFVGNTITFNQ